MSQETSEELRNWNTPRHYGEISFEVFLCLLHPQTKLWSTVTALVFKLTLSIYNLVRVGLTMWYLKKGRFVPVNKTNRKKFLKGVVMSLSHPTSTGVLHCSLHVQCTTATFTQLAGHLNNAFEVLMISSPILSNINISLRFLLGHPKKMFRFPSPSLSWRWVGRSGKKKKKELKHDGILNLTFSLQIKSHQILYLDT